MKARWAVLISFALNAALALAIAWTLKQSPRPAQPTPTTQEVVVTQNVAVAEASLPTVAQSAAIPFNWSKLISDDLKLYRDRLREIGCPERTVRLIILREIYDQFEPRRKALLASLQGQFWELALQGPDEIGKACKKPVESLKEEQQELIKDVLGEEEPKNETEPRRVSRDYDWLPEEKREKMAALDRQLNDVRHATARERRRNSSGRIIPAPEAQKAVQAMEAEVTVARKQLLTPAEHEEYELRKSGAGNWSTGLAGTEVTKDEWLSVARLVRQRDEVAGELSRQLRDKLINQDAFNESTKKLNAELASARKDALGPERAAEVERGWSGDYQQLRAVLQRYDMDSQVAARAYEIQQTALAHANELRKDQNMAPELRRATLEAIRQETERTLAQTLGQKAFATYQKYDRGWFMRLGGPGDAK